MALRALYDIAAPAKLNAFLHVVGRRDDGYHLLQSVFVLIDWLDTLHIETRPDGHLARHDLGAPLPADDLCLRAATALRATSGTSLGADISIEKRIPTGAGLGGGSSDAASTLLALNRLWNLGWPQERLAELGLRLGADVPFFLGGRNAVVEGIGERLTPISIPPVWLAVVKPAASLATATIFRSPLVGRSGEAAIVEGFIGGSSAGHSASLGDFWAYGRNDLQAAAEAECADVAKAAAALERVFGNSRMTGSGSAVFAFAGHGDRPTAEWPGALEAGWEGKMCRSLIEHPLSGWAG
jgi:4-diphosphocytidyl-2-C-methyl-D-erythritol kinase